MQSTGQGKKRSARKKGSDDDDEDFVDARSGVGAGAGASSGAGGAGRRGVPLPAEAAASARSRMAAQMLAALSGATPPHVAFLLAHAANVNATVAEAWQSSLEKQQQQPSYAGPVSDSPFALRIAAVQHASLPPGFIAHLNGGDSGNAESAGGASGDVPLTAGRQPLVLIANYPTPREGRKHLVTNPHTTLFGKVGRAHAAALAAITASGGGKGGGAGAGSSGGGAGGARSGRGRGGAVPPPEGVDSLSSLGDGFFIDGFSFARDPTKRNVAPNILGDKAAVKACENTWEAVMEGVQNGEASSAVVFGATQQPFVLAAVSCVEDSSTIPISQAFLSLADVVAEHTLGLDPEAYGYSFSLAHDNGGGAFLHILPGEEDASYLLRVAQ